LRTAKILYCRKRTTSPRVLKFLSFRRREHSGSLLRSFPCIQHFPYLQNHISSSSNLGGSSRRSSFFFQAVCLWQSLSSEPLPVHYTDTVHWNTEFKVVRCSSLAVAC
jgi:hypothetical protein